MFGAPIPAFNLKGDQSINTNVGGCLSIIILSIVILYGIHMLHKLIIRQNPHINTNLIQDAYDSSEVFNTRTEPDFMLAFGVKIPSSGQLINDYKVKFIAEYS